MEHNNSKNNTGTGQRKMRFIPRAPPRRESKPVIVKKEEAEDADAVQARELLRRFNESSFTGRPKVEKKLAPAQVAFGYGSAKNSMKSYAAPKSGHSSSKSEGGSASASGLREKKEYREPWDYYSYYPVTLPMRRPYSGNPDVLDAEEFGEASESVAYGEESPNPAVELGLMEESQETSMVFIQLPTTMPMIKPSAGADGKNETDNNLKHPKVSRPVEKICRFDELPAGYMGKMLVYKSGAVKLKLGDTVYDVSPGLDCVFAQDVVAINTEGKHCCNVGELSKRAIIVPDVDSILEGRADLG